VERSRILVVEDDRLLAEVLCHSLSLDGFDVVSAADSKGAIANAREFAPDLILLDVMLPDGSAFDLFDNLHHGGQTPIIFLTARGESADRLRGFRLGADDYVTKPFELEELIARIHAVLRRSRTALAELQLGPTTIDLVSGRAVRGADVVHFTDRELEILKYLATRTGRVVYRSELLRALWGYPDDSANTRSVDQAIARLRRKVEPDSDEPRYIRTVRGDGYRLTPGTT
jgi:DNA-binding response OmpR family regulator